MCVLGFKEKVEETVEVQEAKYCLFFKTESSNSADILTSAVELLKD